MPRPSTIDRLPKKIQNLIGRLRKSGRTIDEILEKLNELDVDIARSTMGRHIKGLDKTAEEIRKNHILAEALVNRFGDEPDDKIARLNIQLGFSMLTKFALAKEGGVVEVDAREAMFFSTAVQKLVQADKADSERILKITKEVTNKAADAAETAAREAGLSAERAAELRRKVLGVKTAGSA